MKFPGHIVMACTRKSFQLMLYIEMTVDSDSWPNRHAGDNNAPNRIE